MPLLIRGGEVITADSRTFADVLVEGGTVSAVGLNLPAPPGAEIIDATGKYVFPGFIDPHVHIYLPFMATFAKDTHRTASIAALLGGTTTYIEMCCPSRNENAIEGYRLWRSKAEGQSACDYAFHMSVTHFDGKTPGELDEIVRDGTASLKVFLAYKNFFGIDDGELYRTLRYARERGLIVTAHCENAELIAQLQASFLADGKSGPEWHEPSRPESVEAEGTHHFSTFLENTGAAGYIVHLSCEPALRVAATAKARGVRLSVESVIPHLVLDKTHAERPGVEGIKHVMSPPLRDARNHDALWQGLADGTIDTVGTDHCPFDIEQKRMGEGDFTRIPNGIGGIEERVSLLYTYGVRRRGLDLQRFVAAASTRAAKLFGLYPRKGTIAAGSDADLVVFDPQWKGSLSAAAQASNNDYNGFEGMTIEGRPSLVTVRGQTQMKDGVFVGDPSRGRFLKREPSH